MRTNYNDSSNNRGGRYPKRSNGGSNGGGRRPSSGSNSGGRRSPGQHSNNGGSINVSGVTATRNKYLDMAKEALSHGNRVEAENYFQHAEHYSKLLNASMAARSERGESSDSANNGNGHHRRHNHRNNEQSERPVQDENVVSSAAPSQEVVVIQEVVSQVPLEIQPE